MRTTSSWPNTLALLALGPARMPHSQRSRAAASIAQPPSPPLIPALDDALRLVKPGMDDECARAALDRLEALNRKPFTPAFLELGLSGSWELVRCVPAAPTASGALAGLDWLIDEEDDGAQSEEGFEVVSTLSSFEAASAGFGTLSSAIAWSWARQRVHGTFTVNSSYTLTASGTLQLSRTAAELDVSADLPAGASESLVALLSTSKLVPAPVFDPHKAVLELTYMDHEVMLTRCAGARHGGARMLWRRRFWHAGGASARVEERQRADAAPGLGASSALS